MLKRSSRWIAGLFVASAMLAVAPAWAEQQQEERPLVLAATCKAIRSDQLFKEIQIYVQLGKNGRKATASLSFASTSGLLGDGIVVLESNLQVIKSKSGYRVFGDDMDFDLPIGETVIDGAQKCRTIDVDRLASEGMGDYRIGDRSK